MAYEVDTKKCLKLREAFGVTGTQSVFVYFYSQWKMCEHSHDYGHTCCVNCGGKYADHGASSDVPLPKGGRPHLVCKRLRRPSDNVLPTPRYR